jgi:hypothetical protein
MSTSPISSLSPVGTIAHSYIVDTALLHQKTEYFILCDCSVEVEPPHASATRLRLRNLRKPATAELHCALRGYEAGDQMNERPGYHLRQWLFPSAVKFYEHGKGE